MGVETRQSAVRLRNLLKRAEELLREKGERPPRIRELLVPVTELVEDALSWEYQENGLALFLHRDGMSAYQLPFPVEESVTLSAHFRIRPLIPLVTGDGIFHLLALRLFEARLYECTRRTMQERPVPGLPASIQDILSAYDDERVYQHHASAAKGAGAAKGFNPIKENEKPRIGEYLRGVDLAAGRLLAHDRSPMVVVCVDYLFPMFKAVSRYMPLMDRHVSGSPDTLRPERMLAEAWDVVRPVFEQGRVRAFAQWEALAGTGRVLEGIARILPAAVHGRVETLFLSSPRSPGMASRPGRMRTTPGWRICSTWRPRTPIARAARCFWPTPDRCRPASPASRCCAIDPPIPGSPGSPERADMPSSPDFHVR